MIMVSLGNEIKVSKIKQPSLPISSIYASEKVIKVFHASCMRRSLMSVSYGKTISSLLTTGRLTNTIMTTRFLNKIKPEFIKTPYQSLIVFKSQTPQKIRE